MSHLRQFLAAVVSFALLITPAFAAPSESLGTLVYAQGAHLGSAIASVGSTIFGGDRLSTDASGTLQVRTAAARFLLKSGSNAIFLKDPGAPAAILTRGTACFPRRTRTPLRCMRWTRLLSLTRTSPPSGRSPWSRPTNCWSRVSGENWRASLAVIRNSSAKAKPIALFWKQTVRPRRIRGRQEIDRAIRLIARAKAMPSTFWRQRLQCPRSSCLWKRWSPKTGPSGSRTRQTSVSSFPQGRGNSCAVFPGLRDNVAFVHREHLAVVHDHTAANHRGLHVVCFQRIG